MRGISTLLLLAIAVSTGGAQEFEVVSVKPNKTGSHSSSMHTDQGMLTATNNSLRSLIVMASGLKDYQVEGPDWLESERFDIAAKFPEALPKDRKLYNDGLHAMMQRMLAERFKLAAHRDTKVFSVYGLVVTRSGIKFKEVPDGDSHNSNSSNNHYTGSCIPMTTLASFLSSRMDAPVLDMTGLAGFYDLTLDWVPEPRQSTDSKLDPAQPPVDLQGATLTVALQEQLGLKLEPRKAPLEILVVDRVERVPTEN